MVHHVSMKSHINFTETTKILTFQFGSDSHTTKLRFYFFCLAMKLFWLLLFSSITCCYARTQGLYLVAQFMLEFGKLDLKTGIFSPIANLPNIPEGIAYDRKVSNSQEINCFRMTYFIFGWIHLTIHYLFPSL